MLNISYCSDKYQYTMGKSFYDAGMKDKRATFNFLYRTAPEGNNWAVVCGTDEVVEMIGNLGNADPDFFEKFLPGEEYGEFREYLSKLRFSGNVWAMREGEIAFPNEPIIIVDGPIIEAQVLETPLLCIMNHQMAVATKASRVCRATDKPVSEFGSRRAHGPWAATYGGKAAIIAGCSNTSNILTGVEFGIPSSGTMAHSFVESFGSTVEGEYEAFRTYCKTHRGEPLILLIDTYDTLRCGIKNAIRAFRECGVTNEYKPSFGIRLDSGDLVYLSRECRRILDVNGLQNCRIFATNGLDEYLISSIEEQGACIDSYGVGDAISTSRNAPCFGGVYKLVQIDERPVLKRSEDKIKLINPGFQTTYRICVNDKNKADVICLRGDDMEKAILAGETITVVSEYDRDKTKTFPSGTYKAFRLEEQVVKEGEICLPQRGIMEKKAYFNSVLNSFDPTERRLVNPHYYKVDISDNLYNTKKGIIANLNEAIEKFSL